MDDPNYSKSTERLILFSIRRFKVAGVSDACNNEGLFSILLVDEEGSSYKVGANIQKIQALDLEFDSVVAVGVVEGVPQFDALGLQYLEKADNMPKDMLESLWA